jgi:predicted nucleic acid-binding protein
MNFMSGKCFVDTNILVYVHDLSAGAKCSRAQELTSELWDSRKGVVSTQVLQELYIALRRRLRIPVSIANAAEILRDYFQWEVVINNRDSIIRAAEFEARFKISFWDGLILQAAERAGADLTYSEDLSHGQIYGSVRVLNPFMDS